MLTGAGFQPLGQLLPLPQPGGDQAAREPWRMAAAALYMLGRGEEIDRRFAHRSLAIPLKGLLAKGLNCPLTSSCGRLFDAACGLLGVRETASYEGEAPMALEALVETPRVMDGGWIIEGNDLDLLPVLDALLDLDPVTGAEVFHGTLAAALVDWGANACHANGRDEIVLSGGCIANRVLTSELISGFGKAGITAVMPRRAPVNDGGLSLGQAWVAGLSL
jgi:hydrogenase maturation protein HypF